MSSVFISYSHTDGDIADTVASILEELGIEFFRDAKDIEWGQEVSQRVREGLESAVAIIVIISPGSLKSHWVSYEIGYATALGKRVLPYLTHPAIDPPGFIAGLLYAKSPEAIRKFFGPGSELASAISSGSAKADLASEEHGRNEIPASTSCAQYFAPEEVLVRRDVGNGQSIDLRYETPSLLYLRAIPAVAMPELRQAELVELVRGIKVPPLHNGLEGGSCFGRNNYGGITYSYTDENERPSLLSSTQIFRNRELWGVDGVSLNRGADIFLIESIEEVLERALRVYLEFSFKNLEYSVPVIVEAGTSSVEGYHMLAGIRTLGASVQPEIRHRHVLKSTDPEEVDGALLAIFEEFFDAFAFKRPEKFRGFPA